MSSQSTTAEGRCPAGGDAAILAGASLADPAVQAHPDAFFRAMRQAAPVHFDERLGMWLVSRHADIVEVLLDPITYSDKHGYEAIFAGGFYDEYKSILER